MQEADRLSQQGRFIEAIPKAREALALQEQTLGSIHPDVAMGLNSLALIFQATGDYAGARSLYDRALKIQEQALGPPHPAVAFTIYNLANLLQIAGDYAGARSLYERALKILEEDAGPNRLGVALSLNSLANLLRLTGDYAGARSMCERALKILEEDPGPNRLALAMNLINLANLLQATGDYAAAKLLYERALTIRQQAFGSTHPAVAESLNNLGSLLQATGDYAGARSLYEQALKIHEQALGPAHPNVAMSLNNLALLLHDTGDDAGARPLYERALRIQEQTLGQTHPDVATTLGNLANLLQAMGDYAAARPLYERALQIQEQILGSSHPGLAVSLNGLANLFKAIGEYASARDLYERALQIQEQTLGQTHPDVATTLSNLAEVLRASGDYAAARPLLERAVKIRKQTLGPDHPGVAETLNKLALLLHDTGDEAGARPLYERGLKIREQAFGSSHPAVSESLNNLAELLRDMGDYAAARPLLERAVRISEQALGSTHPEVATRLNNLALLLWDMGDYAMAESLLGRALNIFLQALGPSHPDVATTLGSFAFLLQYTGDYAAAKVLYERALRIFETKLGPDHLRTALALVALAILEWENGRSQDAQPKLARAVAITRQHTDRGLVGLSSRQKLAFLEKTPFVTDAFLSLPSGLVTNAEAYRAVLDRKNLLFRTLAAERAITETTPVPQVAALLQEYTTVRRQLARLAVGAPNLPDLQQYQTYVASLNQQLESLEAKLSRESAAFRQTKAETTAGPAEVCEAVPVDAALFDLFWYWRYVAPAAPGMPSAFGPHYVGFIIRGGACTEPIRVDLGPAAPFDEDVRRLREALSGDTPDPAARELRARYRKTLAARLYARLFPPVLQKVIEGKGRLLIAPDGALALLPFALLPGEDGHEFLLETRTISYVPSGRDLLRAKERPSSAPTLLAVGAPAFDRVPLQVVQAATVRAGCGAQDDPFTPLPGTAAELQAIAMASRQARPTQTVTVLEGAQATKAAIIGEAPKAGILHLATHAYFAGEECTPAGLVSAPPKTMGEAPAFLGYNPLLLAGIALAGANEREKADSILTALEITALDLRATELVVLSACDTGLGTPARSQELLGLRWAFAYAGAQHLVTSLWSVPDVETATLMTHFYTALWGKGLSVPEALRFAQLEMLRAARAKGDSAPHAWGAFVASGYPD